LREKLLKEKEEADRILHNHFAREKALEQARRIFHVDPSTNTIGSFIPLDAPGDPNELVGPAGFGSQNWLRAEPQPLPYTILFENDPKFATVAAQDVFIAQTLDADLVFSSFELGNIQFGSTVVAVPEGLQSFETSVM